MGKMIVGPEVLEPGTLIHYVGLLGEHRPAWISAVGSRAVPITVDLVHLSILGAVVFARVTGVVMDNDTYANNTWHWVEQSG